MSAHCESCGDDDPAIADGYTACCNQPLCYGGGERRFGVPTDFRYACCWAKATDKFGGPSEVPPGSWRLDW